MISFSWTGTHHVDEAATRRLQAWYRAFMDAEFASRAVDGPPIALGPNVDAPGVVKKTINGEAGTTSAKKNPVSIQQVDLCSSWLAHSAHLAGETAPKKLDVHCIGVGMNY